MHPVFFDSYNLHYSSSTLLDKPPHSNHAKASALFEKKAPATKKGPELDVKNLAAKPLAQSILKAAKMALTIPLSEHDRAIGQTFQNLEQFIERIKAGVSNDEKEFLKNDPNAQNILDIYELADHCRDIISFLNDLSADHVNLKKIQRLREKVNDALDSASYQNSSEGFILEFRRFLQLLSYQLNTQPNAMPIYQAVGKEALEKYCPNTSDFSQKVQAVFTQIPADEQGFWWGLKHLFEVFLAFLDNHFGFGYRFYNSYSQGNFNAAIGDFYIGNSRVRFFHGASPTCDALFKAQLEWQKYIGVQHIQHTLEFKDSKGEAKRIKQMQALQKPNSSFDLMGTLLNGDPWNGKGEFKHIKSVKEFHENIKQLILSKNRSEYSGYALPLLTQPDIANALRCSQEAFEQTLKNVSFPLSKEENKRLCRAMLLGLNGFLVIKSLLQLNLHGKHSATLWQACKQGVDRGPMMNAVTIAFAHLLEKGQLDESDQERLVGLLLTRALTADKRLMVDSRRIAVQDLFTLISKDQGLAFTHQLKELGTHNKIRFRGQSFRDVL